MPSNKWDKVQVRTKDGDTEAVAPIIISASRSTDIPAYYTKWFFNRIEQGYAVWTNPFNGKIQYVSFDKARVIAFFTKNPAPLLPYLHILKERNINYYVEMTLNDYDKENLEPNVQPLDRRIEVFKTLADRIGRDKVVWRYDPILLSENIDAKEAVRRVGHVAERLSGHTDKMVFSFIDIDCYKKVRPNLNKRGFADVREPSLSEIEYIATEMARLSKQTGIEVAACCEKIDLSQFGVQPNKCMDDDLMAKLFSHDRELMSFLGYDEQQLFGAQKTLKDKGQRKHCGCIVSKDIGAYATCMHLCAYCYANHSEGLVRSNWKKFQQNKNAERIA